MHALKWGHKNDVKVTWYGHTVYTEQVILDECMNSRYMLQLTNLKKILHSMDNKQLKF